MKKAPTTRGSRGIATQQRNSTIRPSLRLAINRKCRECIYDSNAPGTWRQQVELCKAIKCPLYTTRPVSISESLIALKNPVLAQIDPVSDPAEVVA